MTASWANSLNAHRDEVRESIGDAAWRLVCDRGLLSVTMSQVAAEAGVSRVTLYRYYPDVTTILTSWHHRQVQDHLEQLTASRDASTDTGARLQGVLETYAQICRGRAEHGPGELTDLLHHDNDLEPAHRHLTDLVAGVLQEAARTKQVRDDLPAEQLTAYCLRALTAAADLPADADLSMLVDLVLAGLRPPVVP